MCCITIDTEVILANIFGSPELNLMRGEGIGVDIIEKCAVVLANNLPGYVFYDVTLPAIQKTTLENISFKIEHGKVYYFGNPICREKYNQIYTPTIASKIINLIDGFFKYEMYNDSVTLLVAMA